MKFFSMLSSIVLLLASASGQSSQTLFSFTGVDGEQPFGLIADKAGNFYGVTVGNGGSLNCCGTVYELTHVSGQWTQIVLHQFTGGLDGASPIGTLASDSHGNLFGVTQSGGLQKGRCYSNCGTVFELSPQSGGGWSFAQIYAFRGNQAGDGEEPDAGVTVSSSGDIYGTTESGGVASPEPNCSVYGCGTVFKLSRKANGWSETVLYKFMAGQDGAYPRGPVVFDSHRNLIGTTSQGGGGHCSIGYGLIGCGTVFQLASSGGAWTEKVLHRFHGDDGFIPYQGLVFDAAGNLYGATNLGGANQVGAVFELSPQAGGGWNEETLYSFMGFSDGIFPAGGLSIDSTGNLYGTASSAGANDAGTIFKLTPQSGGSFSFSVVMTLNGTSDGSFPDGNLLLDSAGDLYGTAGFAGANGYGDVFKITP